MLLSAEYRDWTFVETLLEPGADPDRPNDRGETLRGEFENLQPQTHPDQREALERVRVLLRQPAQEQR